MKLRSKILVGFSILIFILIGIAIYTLIFLSSTNTLISEIVGKKFETDKAAQSINYIVMKIHSDILDATIYGKEVKNMKKSEISSDAVKVYDSLRLMIDRMPEKEDVFTGLKKIFQYYISFGTSILNFIDINEFLKNDDIVNKFKENKVNLVTSLEQVTNDSSKEFQNALRKLKNDFTTTNLIMIIITFLAIIIGIFTSLIIANALTKPIYHLVDIMKEVEKDNYEVQAKIITKDEIGKLATTFNNMTKQIKASRENLKDQERLKKEMEIAERIQTSLCPSVPDHDELEIAASMTTAEEVGGDYYDLIFDSAKNLWIAIGDVSGHGVTPGLVMMMAETSFNSFVNDRGNVGTPREAIISVNRVLTENVRNRLNEKHFMTMNFLKYTGSGKFIHAGSHVDILVYRAKTKTCQAFPTEGVYLGIVSDISSHTVDKIINIDIGDALIVYTDGIIESRQKDNVDNLLGLKALKEVIIDNGQKTSELIMTSIKEKALSWCGYKPDDDMSMVVMKRVK